MVKECESLGKGSRGMSLFLLFSRCDTDVHPETVTFACAGAASHQTRSTPSSTRRARYVGSPILDLHLSFGYSSLTGIDT